MDLDTKPILDNITGWQAKSGWFYITLYQVTGDSSSLMPSRLPIGISRFQIFNNEESLQIGLRINKPIQNHEFSLKKNSNSLIASLHYSTEYLAQLDTIKDMKLDKKRFVMKNPLRNWLYITGTGLTLSGILQDPAHKLNNQTNVGIGLLLTTLLVDLIW